MSQPTKTEIIDRAVNDLLEHFDAVQILVSWPNEKGNGTNYCYRGGGNIFARQGMAHDFIARDAAEITADEIGRVVQPQSDDGDEWKNEGNPS